MDHFSIDKHSSPHGISEGLQTAPGPISPSCAMAIDCEKEQDKTAGGEQNLVLEDGNASFSSK